MALRTVGFGMHRVLHLGDIDKQRDLLAVGGFLGEVLVTMAFKALVIGDGFFRASPWHRD